MQPDQWGRADENGHANGNANDPLSVAACAKHYSSRAAGACDDCGELWCSQCLVPKTRKRQPTRCIECALVAAGVRTRGARSTVMTMNRHQKNRPNLI